MEELASAGTAFEGDEARLLARLRAGDADAYEQFVRQHGPRLLAVARRILSHEDDARDATQEAFLSAFKAIHTFDGNARLGTWLHRIAVNAALMRLRSRLRKQEQPIDALLPAFEADGHQAQPARSWSVTADAVAARQETRALVRAAIDRLPETYRTVLLLRDIEELPTEEAARALGVTVGVIKTRLHRARQALRTLLDGQFRGGAL